MGKILIEDLIVPKAIWDTDEIDVLLSSRGFGSNRNSSGNWFELKTIQPGSGDFGRNATMRQTARCVANYDIAIISAYRDKLLFWTDKTLIDIEKGASYTDERKQKRNAELLSKLKSLGYTVINVRGFWTENAGTKDAKRVEEESFFVVNDKKVKTPQAFYNDLFALSEKYNQDSFFYKPKNSEATYFVYTNNAPSIGFGEKEEAGTIHIKPGKGPDVGTLFGKYCMFTRQEAI